MALDFVPLFETVEDLAGAPDQMRTLFATAHYRQPCEKGAAMQHVMLGFSDGTKDGGIPAGQLVHPPGQGTPVRRVP